MKLPDPTVLLVDDDEDVLTATTRLVRSAGYRVEAFRSPRAMLACHSLRFHGCIVLDYAMPEFNGLELQDVLRERKQDVPVIFLTGRGDVPTSVHAMKHGAADFLTKPVIAQTLLDAIETAIACDRELYARRVELDEIEARLARLTPREHEVLGHIVTGKLNKETAAVLGTVEKTVKVHRARVLEKMGVHSAAELARLAERAGIAPPVELGSDA